MNNMLFAAMAGLCFGIFDVLIMIPIKMEEKTTAMTGAFFNRFAIGFLIPLVKAHIPEWETGALVGLLISLPDAIITKAYGPILGIGIVGGALVGLATTMWAG